MTSTTTTMDGNGTNIETRGDQPWPAPSDNGPYYGQADEAFWPATGIQFHTDAISEAAPVKYPWQAPDAVNQPTGGDLAPNDESEDEDRTVRADADMRDISAVAIYQEPGAPEGTGKKKYAVRRTQRQAKEGGTVDIKSDMLVVPTLPQYRDALTIIGSDYAHLQVLQEALARQITYKNGKLYFHGRDLDDDYLSRCHDDRPEASADVDLPLLYLVYSLIYESIESLADTEEERNDVINNPAFRKYSLKFYIPAIFKKMGTTSGINARTIEAFIDKIGSYHNIWGIIPTKWGPSHYPALLMLEHDAEDNSVEILSPYFNKLIMLSRRDSIRLDKKGYPMLDRSGKPLMRPSQSHLIKGDIVKERNKRAVQIVRIITVLIEESGGCGAKIRAQTIIDRCPDLAYALSQCSSVNAQNNLLRRTFSKVWELLKTQTKLLEAYPNIQIPTNTPKMSHLNETFEFRHDPKIASRTPRNISSQKGKP